MLRRRNTTILAVSLIGLISACGTPTVRQSGASPAATTASRPKPNATQEVPTATIVPAETEAASTTVVQSDGSVCTSITTPGSVGSDQAVGTTGCFCNYDLFSSEDPPTCFLGTHVRTWMHPDGQTGPVGHKLNEIPTDTLSFKPSIPPDLEIQAVSISDFGVSGTYPGLGRMIIAEVANDPLLGGGLQEQIALTSKLSGSVMERLTDDNPDNDATVVSATGVEAIVRFPQDSRTVKGQPAFEQVEWISGDTRFSVVIQLGEGVTLQDPAYGESIGRFIDSFGPIA